MKTIRISTGRALLASASDRRDNSIIGIPIVFAKLKSWTAGRIVAYVKERFSSTGTYRFTSHVGVDRSDAFALIIILVACPIILIILVIAFEMV